MYLTFFKYKYIFLYTDDDIISRSDLITNFLNECKIKLSKRNFEFIVQSFQNFKDGKINEEKVMLEIKTILQNYPQINNLFESIFIIK